MLLLLLLLLLLNINMFGHLCLHTCSVIMKMCVFDPVRYAHIIGKHKHEPILQEWEGGNMGDP